MGKQEKPTRWYIAVAAVVLSWLGLAGLADNVVEWKLWFEVGILTHWRNLLSWLGANLFFWVPFSVPFWVVNYFVLGGIYGRSITLSLNRAVDEDPFTEAIKELALQRWREMRESMSTKDRLLHFLRATWLETKGVLLNLTVWLAQTLIWPLSLIGSLLVFFAMRGMRHNPVRSWVSMTIRLFFVSLMTFIPILFVATDFVATFG